MSDTKTIRSFQCRDHLWQKFEEMASELECSVDYLINDSMKQYARQRGYGGSRTVGQASPSRTALEPPKAPGGSPSSGQHELPSPDSGPALGAAPVAPLAGALPEAPPPPPPVPPSPKAPPPTRSRAAAPAAAGRGHSPPPPAPPPRKPTPSPAPPPPGLSASRVAPPPPPAPPPPGATGAVAPPPPPAPALVAPPPPPRVGGSSVQQKVLTCLYDGQLYKVTKDRFIIGRGKQTTDLTIKDPNVSRQHAMVELMNGKYFMVDMGSTNGVEFGGKRVQRHEVQHGDTFRVCDHVLLFTYE